MSRAYEAQKAAIQVRSFAGKHYKKRTRHIGVDEYNMLLGVADILDQVTEVFSALKVLASATEGERYEPGGTPATG